MVEVHLAGGFVEEVKNIGSKLVDATIELHRHVVNNFLPRCGSLGAGGQLIAFCWVPSLKAQWPEPAACPPNNLPAALSSSITSST